MVISVPDGANFRFDGGTMYSDLIGSEEYKHYFTKGDSLVPPTDWERNNIGETSMRAVCHLDKSSNGAEGPKAKMTILIFPRSTDEMNELSDSTQSPAWPGVRILEASCIFSPSIAQWKDPICPLFVTGSPLTEAANCPSTQEIRHQIAAVMRTAKRPTACTSSRALKTQWEKATRDIEALEQEPTITWPEADRHQPEQGKHTTVNQWIYMHTVQ